MMSIRMTRDPNQHLVATVAALDRQVIIQVVYGLCVLEAEDPPAQQCPRHKPRLGQEWARPLEPDIRAL